MKKGFVCLGLLLLFLLITGCQYRKGKSFTWAETGDSINYLIIDSGSGRHISEKIAKLSRMHERKGDSCRVLYLSDSVGINNNKSILLFHSVLPNLKNDMLSKGFIGTFSTRQNITYLVVQRDELQQYLKPSN